jgi:hypothetical protein
MYKLSSLFSSRPSWLESFYEILAASNGQGGILMPDTIVMQCDGAFTHRVFVTFEQVPQDERRVRIRPRPFGTKDRPGAGRARDH